MQKNKCDEYEDLWRTNRQKKLRPKPGIGWCICDQYKVWEWQKCPVCRRRNGVRRNKKE